MSRFNFVTEDPWKRRTVPATTQPQLDFISSLCERLGYDPDEYAPENIREASEIIDALKEDMGYG